MESQFDCYWSLVFSKLVYHLLFSAAAFPTLSGLYKNIQLLKPHYNQHCFKFEMFFLFTSS